MNTIGKNWSFQKHQFKFKTISRTIWNSWSQNLAAFLSSLELVAQNFFGVFGPWIHQARFFGLCWIVRINMKRTFYSINIFQNIYNLVNLYNLPSFLYLFKNFNYSFLHLFPRTFLGNVPYSVPSRLRFYIKKNLLL